ncbi:MAG: nuclear transport factor 2 family protein [Pseudomonadota bacterium]
MRAASWIWIIVGALIVPSVHAEQGVGDYHGLPADLAAAAAAYDIAQLKSDRAGLERYLADDYTLADSNGNNRNKAESIADAIVPGNKTTYVAISRQVRKAWSDGAVLGGMVDAKGVDRGKPYTMRARFVDVWARRGGRWQVVFTQIHRALPGE